MFGLRQTLPWRLARPGSIRTTSRSSRPNPSGKGAPAPPGRRGTLGKSPLDDPQLIALTSSLAGAGPLELLPLLAAYERSKNPAVAHSLLAVLPKAPGFTSLPGEALRGVLAGYPDAVRTAAIPLLKRLEVDRQTQKARLAELEPLLASGDASRGKSVFFGRTAACSTCHLVKSDGGHIGPDLSKIGSIRTGRDLLEAVVFPSAEPRPRLRAVCDRHARRPPVHGHAGPRNGRGNLSEHVGRSRGQDSARPD